MNDAPRRVPISNSYIERDRRGQDCEIGEQERENCQGQSDAIIKDALVFEAFNLSLLSANLQASRAKMLAVQFAIA